MAHTPRPVVSEFGGICPACGKVIKKGRDRVMLRFKYKDWVHANRPCLNAKTLYDASGQLVTVDLAPATVPVDERQPNPF